MSIAAVVLGALVALVVCLMLTKRFQFPLLTDFGMGMVALGALGAIDSIVTGWSCSDEAIALRWGLLGGGMLLVLLSISLRLRRRRGRRLADVVVIDPNDMRHISGGKR